VKKKKRPLKNFFSAGPSIPIKRFSG